MNNEIKLTLVTPAGVYLEKNVPSVIIPAVRAGVDILPERAPSVFVLDFGVVRVASKNNSDSEIYFVYPGMAEVMQNQCLVMTQGVVAAKDITSHEAKSRLEKSEDEQEQLFYQMVLDYQRGVRRRYLKTLNLFSKLKKQKKANAGKK